MLSEGILKRTERPGKWISRQVDPPVRLHGGTENDFSLAYQLTNECHCVDYLKDFIAKHPTFDLNSGGRCGYTILSIAMERDDFELAAFLLDWEPAIAKELHFHTYPYLVSAASTSLEWVKFLHARGANVNDHSAAHETPLASANREDIIEYLLLNGGYMYESSFIHHEKYGASPETKFHYQSVYHVCMKIKRDYYSNFGSFCDHLFPKHSLASNPFCQLPYDIGTLVMNHLPGNAKRFALLLRAGLIRQAPP